MRCLTCMFCHKVHAVQVQQSVHLQYIIAAWLSWHRGEAILSSQATFSSLAGPAWCRALLLASSAPLFPTPLQHACNKISEREMRVYRRWHFVSLFYYLCIWCVEKGRLRLGRQVTCARRYGNVISLVRIATMLLCLPLPRPSPPSTP